MTSAQQAKKKKKSGVMKPHKSENTICLAGLKRLGRLLDGIHRPSAVIFLSTTKESQNLGMSFYWTRRGKRGEGRSYREIFCCPTFVSFGIDLMGDEGKPIVDCFRMGGFDRGIGRRRGERKRLGKSCAQLMFSKPCCVDDTEIGK